MHGKGFAAATAVYVIYVEAYHTTRSFSLRAGELSIPALACADISFVKRTPCGAFASHVLWATCTY
jgi:hypothetical protein